MAHYHGPWPVKPTIVEHDHERGEINIHVNPAKGVTLPGKWSSRERIMAGLPTKRVILERVRRVTGNPRMGWKAARKWIKRQMRTR